MKHKPPYEADLHNHTRFSDGDFSPSELIGYAKSLNLKAVAVTDHDSTGGLHEALAEGKRLGIEVVCGVEITVRFIEPVFKGSLHILGYFPETLVSNPEFMRHTAAVLATGRGPRLVSDRVAAINAWFGPHGKTPVLPAPMQDEMLQKQSDTVTRRHFMLALKEMGISNSETINRIIGNDSVAYIPSGVPLESLSEYFKSWPLVTVLAHPAAGSYPEDSHYKEVLPPFETVEQLLPSILNLGIDGLEVYYPAHSEAWIERLLTLCDTLNLPVRSGGSDCHDSESRPLGVCGVSMAVVHQLHLLWNARKNRTGWNRCCDRQFQ